MKPFSEAFIDLLKAIIDNTYESFKIFFPSLNAFSSSILVNRNAAERIGPHVHTSVDIFIMTFWLGLSDENNLVNISCPKVGKDPREGLKRPKNFLLLKDLEDI